MIRYRGLTWDHPRGFDALAAAARLASGAEMSLEWDRQPLEGFESQPVRDLCRGYDLIVLDHPHVGEAVADGCLHPLENVFTSQQIASWRADTIGPCFESYRWDGRCWALPLDAATQVMAIRPDLVPELPRTWDEVLGLSARQTVALSLGGPHALLTFFSVSAALGEPPGHADPANLVSIEAGTAALDLMAVLFHRTPPAARELNPIRLLDAMSAGSASGGPAAIALCPLVYGYATYASAGGERRPLAFHDAPRISAAGRPGSTLGGTGIGLSRHCEPAPALVNHLRWLMSRDAQLQFIPSHSGQPSRREAWHDEALDAASGGFYRNTAATVEAAYVRPRHRGYVAFQTEASGLLRQWLADRTPHRTIVERLQTAYARSGVPI